jgi:hypothetical protein
MSATALTSIQEIIERSLFEIIRLEIVDKGYLPDVADTGTYPDTDPGWTQWETDISAIVTSMGFAIELFSGGNPEAKGIMKLPRIVLNPGNFLPGALGGDPRRFFEDKTTHYQALVTPPQTVDFYLNFHLISETIAQARILNAILALAVPRRGYIPWYNDGTKTFFARYLNYYDQSDTDQGVIEHVYAYEVPDAWDREDVESYATIAKINEITLNTNLQKYMDRTWGHDSDPLVVT